MKKVLLVLLILASCAPVVDDKFTVGVILPLTGPAASTGADFQQGMQLAIEDLKPRVEFDIQDSKSNPRDGLSAAQQLVTKDIDVLSSILSAISVPLVPLATENQIPLVSSVVPRPPPPRPPPPRP